MGLMKGKRGLIMGLANDKSLAWGIAKALHAQGAELVGQRAGDRLAGAPHQVLQRQGKGEGLPAPAMGLCDRQVEQAKAMPDAHRERHEQPTAH